MNKFYDYESTTNSGKDTEIHIITPKGEKVEVHELRQFCIEQRVYGNNKGWVCSKIN